MTKTHSTHHGRCTQHTRLVPCDATDLSALDDIHLAKLVGHVTNTLTIDENVTMPAYEFIAVGQDVDLFDDMSDESILDIVKGDTVCEQLECENEDPEKYETTVSETRNALSLTLSVLQVLNSL